MTNKKKNHESTTGVSCECVAFMADVTREENGYDCSTMMSWVSEMIRDCDCAKIMVRDFETGERRELR